METASLRVKFTPLIKDFHNGLSKCCLEIVPEISATQNLDKLAWTVDENIVEYTLPMTYKIIIKKKALSNKESNDLVKIYHSCVDFHNYSFSNIDVECRKVVRMLSDNILFNKLASNVEGCNLFLTKEISLKDTCDEASRRKSIVEIKPENNLAGSSDTLIGKHYTCAMTYEGTPARKDSRENLAKYEINKLLNEKDKIFNHVKVTNDDMAKNTNAKQVYDKYKCKLSLSPICSVNTCDYPAAAMNNKCSFSFDWQTLNSKIKDLNPQYYNTYQANLVTSVKFIKPSGFLLEKQANVEKKPLFDPKIGRNKILLKRVLPEVRVACFVQKLQSEILPLQMLLNEIKSKCLYLGVLNKSKDTPNVILYKKLFRGDNFYCNTTLTTPLYYESVNKIHPLKHKLLPQESQSILRNQKSKRSQATDWLKSGKSSGFLISERKQEKGDDTQRAKRNLTKCAMSKNSNRVVYSIVYDNSN